MNLLELFFLRPAWSEILSKLPRLFWRFLFRCIQEVNVIGRDNERVYLIAPPFNYEDMEEIKLRADFYAPCLFEKIVIQQRAPNLRAILSKKLIVIFGPRSRFLDWLIVMRPDTFDIDFRRNPMDGWAWIGLADNLQHEPLDLADAKRRLSDRIVALKKDYRSKCYIFGTGPSLEKAIDRDWTDGYRIVCNTIVRDAILWHHIQPDFVVAGDAIYHFGHTEFARAFRRDLRTRLEESQTLFVYPAMFHAIIIRELKGFEDRLVPIPSGRRRAINIDLTDHFRLPNLGNVLGLLLLPLGCSLSKHIHLFGFDGRAPNDRLFWSNSNKHTYSEYMDGLKRAHPRFFDHYVPASDPNKYVRENQGDQLERSLQFAERSGWTFEMMHSSWTPTLQRRFHGDQQYGF